MEIYTAQLVTEVLMPWFLHGRLPIITSQSNTRDLLRLLKQLAVAEYAIMILEGDREHHWETFQRSTGVPILRKLLDA
jgi:hypothetical protein